MFSEIVFELRNFKLGPTCFMASIDVTVLFDNVSTSSFMQYLPRLLAETECEWRPLASHFANASISEIVSCFDFILSNSLFKFSGRILCQKIGVPMGNPLSVSVSDIYLGLLEQEFLKSCPTAFKPILYCRYIDDIFLFFDGPTTLLNEFLNYVHNFLAKT